MSLVFCAACQRDVPLMTEKIKRYLDEHPTATISQLSLALLIPVDRITTLYQLGQFQIRLNVPKPEPALTNRPCSICRRALKPQEDVYCDPCCKIINSRLHSQYTRTSTNPMSSSRNGDGKAGEHGKVKANRQNRRPV